MRQIAFVFVLLSFSPAYAQQLVIRSAVPDLNAGTLFVAGDNFGTSPAVAICPEWHWLQGDCSACRALVLRSFSLIHAFPRCHA
jgi:hypothetical protein